MVRRYSTRFKLNLVVNFTFQWHARGFEHIGVLSDQVGPTGRLGTQLRLSLPCTSTRACLHGSHVVCGIQQHQPSLSHLYRMSRSSYLILHNSTLATGEVDIACRVTVPWCSAHSTDNVHACQSMTGFDARSQSIPNTMSWFKLGGP